MQNKLILGALLFLPITIQSAEVLSPDAQLVKAVKDCNVEKVNEALKNGANINIYADFGRFTLSQTPLHYAASSHYIGYIEIVKTLIEKNADIFAKNSLNNSLLHVATKVEVVNMLIMARANVNDVANEKLTALHHVSHSDIAKALINAKANINAQDNIGYTPLFYAGIYCRTEVVKVLLEYGADTTLRNLCNRSIPEQICRSGRRENEIMKIIEDHEKWQAQIPQILEEITKFFANNRDQFNFTEPLVKIITQYLIQNKL